MPLDFSIGSVVQTLFIILCVLFILKSMKNDSTVGSWLYTIDKARSIRYLLAYNMAFIIGTYIFLLFFPYILVTAIVLGIILIILLFDVIIFVINLILFLVGGQINYIDPGFAINLGNTVFSYEEFMDLWMIGLGPLGFPVFGFIAFFLAGRHAGNYAEDGKAAHLVSVPIIILYSAIIYLMYLVFQQEFIVNSQLFFVFITGQIILYQIGIYYYSKKKDQIDEYQLPEAGNIKSKLVIIFNILPIFFVLVNFIRHINLPSYFDATLIDDYGLTMIDLILFTISDLILLGILGAIIFFSIQGDFPLSIKLEELEEREDLLELAKEFRELNEDNIDEFAQQSNNVRFN